MAPLARLLQRCVLSLSLSARGAPGFLRWVLVCGLAAASPSFAAPVTDAIGLSAGQSHTCAVQASGGVKCWGSDFDGVLANFEVNVSSGALDALMAESIVAVAAGARHNCAISTSGSLFCWGNNSNGQLALDPASAIGTSFQRIPGMSTDVTAVAGGSDFTCAVGLGGMVKCWGGNAGGQLGDGSTTQRYLPRTVTGLASGAVAVAAADAAACALTSSGGVKCWGDNTFGQLGDGGNAQRSVPADVVGLTSGVAAVVGSGAHFCALTTAGGVKCWGKNTDGELGDNSVSNRNVPVEVSSLGSGVSHVAAGLQHTCAALTAGGVQCWGRNEYGQLGDGTLEQRLVPATATGIVGPVAALAGGHTHTCAALSGGDVYCWGGNFSTQLSLPADYVHPHPANAVDNLNGNAAKIDSGGSFSCVVTASGGVKCWGFNGTGRLGDGTDILRARATDVSGLTSGVTSVAAGSAHACALTTLGGVKCWGDNTYGQLGDGAAATKRLTPEFVTGLEAGVVGIAAGTWHTCAVTTAGAMKCWGRNDFGQLGDNSFTQRVLPVDVTGLTSGVSSLSAGRSHTCAVVSGAVQCWGLNASGQLGDGTAVDKLVPVTASGLTAEMADVATGNSMSCARSLAGAVHCWGDNFSGEIGDGTNTQRRVPTPVTGLNTGVAKLSVGTRHTCVVMAGGEVRCWGNNSQSQVGPGGNYNTPYSIFGLVGAAQEVAAGSGHTCALLVTGFVQCWGDYTFGQRGNGDYGGAPLPTETYAWDMTPDPFTFTPQSDVPLSVFRSSDPVTITGMSLVPAAVRVVNGEFSVKCTGIFVTGFGLVKEGEQICVRHVSAGAPGTAMTTTLYVGDGSATFTTTTSTSVAAATLTVVRTGSGMGTVTGDPIGIQCGATCSASYPLGQKVTLTAVADAGSTFMGWSGAPCLGGSSQATCSFALRDIAKVRATFRAGAAAGRARISSLSAIDANGVLSSWAGATSNGTGLAGAFPQQVDTDTRWTEIETGVGLRSDGKLLTWGSSASCRLGQFRFESNVALPTRYVDFGNWSKFSQGTPTLALRDDGTLWTWGPNDVSGTPSTCPPLQVGADANWGEVAAGSGYSFGLKTDGTLWHWGSVFSSGLPASALPAQVGAENDWAAISAGGDHVLLLKSNGTLWAFGGNLSGQLGTGTTATAPLPMQVGAETNWAAIEAGPSVSYGLKTDGTLWSWGSNSFGKLGIGSLDMTRLVPVQVGNLSDWVSVSAGFNHAIGLRADGSVWGWGSAQQGALGDGRITFESRLPIQVGKATPSVSITRSPNPSQVGQAVTVTATLVAPGHALTGTMTFRDGNATIPSCVDVPLSGGIATCVVSSFAGGTHSLFAAFSGHATLNPVYSVVLSQNVGPMQLTVTKTGPGAGTVVSQPAGINCGTACTAQFAFNATVTLTATPAAGSAFSAWTNCPGATGNVCSISGTGAMTVNAAFVSTASARRADVNGDGRSDVIWYHTGVFGLIGMPANGLALGPYFVIDVRPSIDWRFAGTGDLDGDGHADVIWQNMATGEVLGLLMNGGTVLAQGTIAFEPNLQWRILQVADTDGDGKADLIWKNAATGDVFVMKMNGLAQVGGQVVYSEPNLDWKLIASGDMNGDGKADLLWRNFVTGDVFAMIMDGFTVVSGGVIYTEPNLDWKIVGLADFNGDGKADVLWQNVTTGDVFEMQMNGTMVLAGNVIYSEPATDWKIVALGDYDGDGKADLLWQNTTSGNVYMMLMNGFVVKAANFVYAEPDTQWMIMGP